jgi:hypothetical protein
LATSYGIARARARRPGALTEKLEVRSRMTQANFGVSRGSGAVFVLPLLLAVALNGCGSEEHLIWPASDSAQEVEDPSALGTLRLPLVTPDTGKFRLRGAIFAIDRAGVPVLRLDSDVDPDAEALTASLNPGQYTSALEAGWSLEALADDGTATPVRAALISANPQSFSVRNERVTNVAYTFTTSSGVVQFGEGSLNVRIGVADPASLGSCDLTNSASCPTGQHCLLGDGDATFCATPGDIEVGEPCGSEQCVFGAQCLSLDPAAPDHSLCTALCNPEAPPFGCDCRGLSISDQVGVCGPPPAGACDLLDPSSCPEQQACQFPGGSFGVCGTPGVLTEGQSCFGEECAAGLDCVGDDPQFGFLGICRRFCDLDAPDCDFCFDVGTGRVGRCFL